MSNLQVGIRLHDMEPTSLENRLALAKEQDFSCIHLASKIVYKEYGIDRHGLTPGLAAHIRRECEKNNLNIAIYGCYLNLANPDQTQLNEIIEEYKAKHPVCSLAGRTASRTETGCPNTTYSSALKHYEEEALVYFLKNLKTVVDYAQHYSVTIAIEPVWKHIIYNPKRARLALDFISSPHLKLIFDPVNMLWEGNHTDQKVIFQEMLERKQF